MNIKFNRTVLAEALGLAAAVVPARTTKAVLQSVKITAGKDGVLLSATDLEIGLTVVVSQAQVQQEGEAVIPADKFTAIVRESIDEVLQLQSADGTTHIKGADSSYTIYGHQPAQFPSMPSFEGGAHLEVELSKLQEACEHCIFAAAKENTRYALSGILLEAADKKLTLVGTDGRRLAKYKLALHKEADKKLSAEKIIIPSKALSLLHRIASGEKDIAAMRLESGKIIIASGGILISSNLVEGSFPKYEDIIPTDYKNKLQLNTAAALSAVRRASLLTNEDSKGIKLSLNKNSLVFTCRAPEMGDSEIAMQVEYKGEPLEIGFNPQFLIDAMKVIREDSFELQLGGADRPGLLKSGTNYVYIVMPVSLS